MIVRPARAEDAAPLVALWNPWIAETAITFSTALKTEAGVAADIAARGAGFQVAEEAGELLGFATFFPFRSGPGYARTKEHTVILSPRARGRGAGRALMTAIEAEARGQGVHSLFAGVSAENPDGVAFHAAIGFREAARLPQVGYKFGRWMDLVLMQKFL
ncbi:N-acetyltransferase family protein [Salipiger sp. P9]|uniref:GNAT family N-acetyltransferase n=1 Tax=Salipiger pentaromativorans TaxID=2943193 RepID=UPI002157C67B|nr:GNAT family N-acetyltransferase [Salipiger pentaromativorans]MCR8546660.1 N-acetyltransferase family protein [Salipiger pentaromativorans]